MGPREALASLDEPDPFPHDPGTRLVGDPDPKVAAVPQSGLGDLGAVLGPDAGPPVRVRPPGAAERCHAGDDVLVHAHRQGRRVRVVSLGGLQVEQEGPRRARPDPEPERVGSLAGPGIAGPGGHVGSRARLRSRRPSRRRLAARRSPRTGSRGGAKGDWADSGGHTPDSPLASNGEGERPKRLLRAPGVPVLSCP
jgi:hypothetical protein